MMAKEVILLRQENQALRERVHVQQETIDTQPLDRAAALDRGAVHNARLVRSAAKANTNEEKEEECEEEDTKTSL